VGVILGAIPVSQLPTYLPALALVQGLHALGYVEGKNLVLEWRSAETRYERIPEIIRELVSNNVDVLVVTTYPVALAAKDATQTTPIVTVTHPDPVGTGLAWAHRAARAACPRRRGGRIGTRLCCTACVGNWHSRAMPQSITSMTEIEGARDQR